MKTCLRPSLAAAAVAAFLLTSVAALAPARADGPARPFGLGIMLGAPSGLSGKYYLGGGTALQMGLGFIEEVGDDGLHVHLDIVWHPVILTSTPAFTMPFYVGVGGRLLEHDEGYYVGPGRDWYHEDDTHLGVRVPFGLLLDFNRVPLDVFLELAMVVDFVHIDHDDAYEHDHDTAGLNGALGVRYYF